MRSVLRCSALISLCLWTVVAGETDHGFERVPKPLFFDPHYHGSCDPEIVWNACTGEWWIFYTARRATREHGTYVGTPIGVAGGL